MQNETIIIAQAILVGIVILTVGLGFAITYSASQIVRAQRMKPTKINIFLPQDLSEDVEVSLTDGQDVDIE